MEEIKNESLAPEQVAENVEVTTEETPKTYTEAEFNAKLDEVLGKKIARREAKIRKEYDREFGELLDVLEAGTGKRDVKELKVAFTDHYTKHGVKIPEKPVYSEKDEAILAEAEANEIIGSGYDEVVEELKGLAAIGLDNMNPRERQKFKVLNSYRLKTERSNEFGKMGVTRDVYESKEFQDFVGKFSHNTPVKDILDIYQKTLPKKNIKPMGSMTNTESTDSGIKEFYSVDEARSFSQDEVNKNPALAAAIERSMQKWKR